ncbi:MAG: hypothetical protein ABR956_13975 [Terracidiphilus sp.]
MKKIGWFSGLSNQRPSPVMMRRIAGGIGTAILLTVTEIACAQNPTPAVPLPAAETPMAAPAGYSTHQSVDLGGRIAGVSGSGAMYSTLVNMQSGPRVLGETFELRALPGTKNTLVDSLRAFGTGFGGDPNSFSKLDFSKGKIYEFSGLFRRDRQYFDYDLLGNPNIPGGQSIPIGTGGSFAWPQVEQSPFLFNTVRRMTDTNLTIFPLAKVTFRAGYSQNIFQGPSLSPSGYGFATGDAILSEYQRNSTDDFIGAVDWKPVQGTRVTFEEQITHYKGDSFFTLAPQDFIAQEADGTKVALNNYDSLTPLKDSCDTFAQGSSPVFTAPQTAGGLPVISPYCSAVTGYTRTQPTRVLTPTEIFRLQSTSIRHVSMNGDFTYTNANMNLPNYYDSYTGLNETAVKSGTPPATTGYYGVRSLSYAGYANAEREVVAADYGADWEVTRKFSLSDQVSFSSVHQPGTASITSVTTVKTPTDTAAAFGSASINYPNLITTAAAAGSSTFEGSGAVGTPLPGYFGQKFVINNATGTWDASSRATLSLTYRYSSHTIAQGIPHDAPLAVGATSNGTVSINENGGILNAALRPSANWNINGTVEILYADNAFTPVGARQTKHYRVHTMYRPRPWATISGAFNDLERHNNTNNNQSAVAAGDDPYEGPLNHVDHSRVVSLGAVLMPNEHYGLDFDYAYSDVYAATNICYDNGAQNASSVVGLPGTASANSGGGPNVCPGVFTRGSTTQLADWFARDFMDAPTQYGSVALAWSPVKRVHSNLGYRISAVNGTQFFNDARSVNGSLQSAYQSPFVNIAWTVHTGLIWKAEYNYYGYGEGGLSGPQNCSTSTSLTSTVVPCASLYNPANPTTVTGLTESPAGLTAPRNFHANNLTLGLHYEF